MAKRGRPRSERAASAVIMRIKMRLYPGEDDDLIEFFSQIPAGLRAVSAKQALRSGLGPEITAEGIDCGNLVTKLNDLIS